MGVSIPLINTATSTFQNWVNKTNLLINAISNAVMTVDSSSNGSYSEGNAQVNGIFFANTLVANVIRGGNVASNGILDIYANSIFLGNSTVNAFANSSLWRTSQIIL